MVKKYIKRNVNRFGADSESEYYEADSESSESEGADTAGAAGAAGAQDGSANGDVSHYSGDVAAAVDEHFVNKPKAQWAARYDEEERDMVQLESEIVKETEQLDASASYDDSSNLPSTSNNSKESTTMDNSEFKRRSNGEESSAKLIRTADINFNERNKNKAVNDLSNRETEESQPQVPGYAVSKQFNNVYEVAKNKTKKNHEELRGSNSTNFNRTKKSKSKSGIGNNKEKDEGAAVMEDKKLRKTSQNASEATEDQQSNKSNSGESGDESDTSKGKNNKIRDSVLNQLVKVKGVVEKLMNKIGVPDIKDFEAVVQYTCRVCSKRFKLAGRYKNHLKNQHGVWEPKISEHCMRLVCPFCYEEKSPKSYNSHIQLRHNKYLQ